MSDTTAVSLGYLGRLAHLQGRYAAALDSYRQALEIVAELKDQRGLVEFTLLETETLLDLGNHARASQSLERVAGWLAAGGTDEHRARLLGLRARLTVLQGQHSRALRGYDEALAAAAASHNPAAVVEARLGRAQALLASGETAAAATALATADEEARLLGDVPLRRGVTAAQARCALAQGQAAAAAAAAREGLALLPTGTPWGGSWRLHGVLAEASQRLGDDAAARASRQRAAAELDRLREQLAPPLRSSFEALPEVRALAEPAARPPR